MGQIRGVCVAFPAGNINVSHSRWTDSKIKTDRRTTHLRELVSNTSVWIETVRQHGMRHTRGRKQRSRAKLMLEASAAQLQSEDQLLCSKQSWT